VIEAAKSQPVHQPRAAEVLTIVDLFFVLTRYKKTVFGVPIVAALATTIATLLLADVYTASSRVLPPQQNQSHAAILGQLNILGGTAAGALGLKNQGEIYIGMLKSRSLADSLIERFNLKEAFQTTTADDTRRALAKVTRISSGRDGIILIEVDDSNPNRAATLANGYVEELEKINDRLAVTEAAQRRLFFERQLRQQKEALATAEVELKKTQEQTGLIKLDEQGKALFEAVAHLRGQIAAKEVQIGAMRSFSTEHNPDRIRAEAELAGLRQQLSRLERSTTTLDKSTFFPAGKVPELGLAFIRKLRDVKYHESLFELLAKQYELARVDESRDTSIIQVLDKAVEPEKRSGPPRALIVAVVTLVVCALMVMGLLIRESFVRRGS
jgi:uncharacterized protein involved in exopolysaccharide biosynthesis